MGGCTRRGGTKGPVDLLAALAGVLLALAVLFPAATTGRPVRRTTAGLQPRAAPQWLALAEHGVGLAQRWWNPKLGFYDSRLADPSRYPLATIWDSVPLFETLDAIELAAPSAAHRAQLLSFAAKAETYLDRRLRPMPGYAPYPGDRGPGAETWFDDDAWWGVAFDDAYRATGIHRYLRDAERAMRYAAAAGWDPSEGGMWWNTAHPYKSGPALAANALLAALIHEQTGSAASLALAEHYLAWGDENLAESGDLWQDSSVDPTPVDYVEAAMIYARELLCRAGAGEWCGQAQAAARTALTRFELDAPQYDVIYDHWMLALAAATGEASWTQPAEGDGLMAQTNAAGPEGLWLEAWSGGSLAGLVTSPGMLQTQAATTELYAWLAVYQPAS
jgi:hypothetical protein